MRELVVKAMTSYHLEDGEHMREVFFFLRGKEGGRLGERKTASARPSRWNMASPTGSLRGW